VAGVHTYKQLGRNVSIYAIDHSVGSGGRNRRDDVQLIQVLINRYIDEKEKNFPALNMMPEFSTDRAVQSRNSLSMAYVVRARLLPSSRPSAR
jgi:hypothetical protein